MEVPTNIKPSGKELKGLLRNAEKSAEIINLVYVTDKTPGISRVRKGADFVYFRNEKKITNEEDLTRIKKLVIPPAWENVWICSSPNGHLQATGFDAKNRKQYRYLSSWNEFRNQTKFYQLLAFGKKLPALRGQLKKDLAKPGLPVEKILAALVLIMQETSMRVGNNSYEKLYGSFGLTTLKDKHVKINGSELRFSFKGKKGVYHDINLKSKKLAQIVKQCRDIPGSELFQYYDEQGEKKSIDSGMVNEYIKNICCDNFTTKDFRTWLGSVFAIEALKESGDPGTDSGKKEKMLRALDAVAKRLGNTRTVCKKYYVHPGILTLYTNGELRKFLGINNASQENFSEAECVLLKILQTM